MGIFLVERTNSGEKGRLVESKTRVGAVAHVAKDTLTASLISTKQALMLGAQGVELEVAGAEEPTAQLSLAG